jgi:hypothetical protein
MLDYEHYFKKVTPHITDELLIPADEDEPVVKQLEDDEKDNEEKAK